VVDDDASFLKAVARLLRASGFAVKTFSSAEALLANTEAELPGCVVADLHMPGLNGLELQAALAHTRCGLPVVFLSGQGDIPATVQAMRGGAEDFLTKTAPKEALLDAVRRAVARDTAERAAHGERQMLRTAFAAFTPRELEILAHVLSGQLNKQIAADLGINERSVKRHRTSFMLKLKVQSVAELTRLAISAGIWDGQRVTV
jgi:FixJ family two-component response regulator